MTVGVIAAMAESSAVHKAGGEEEPRKRPGVS